MEQSSTTKFRSGDMIMANNGRGDCYCVNRIITAPDGTPTFYDLDNGAVHVKKRARSGWHPVSKIDRYYRKVD